jgi:hypothetical protein
MILTRQERERLVLDLCYNQGKNHAGDISRSWNIIRGYRCHFEKGTRRKGIIRRANIRDVCLSTQATIYFR